MARGKTDRRRKALLAYAQRVIRQRYAEFDLSLAEIAAAVGASPRQVQRVFREQADMEFRAYVLKVRMEHAHRLLSRKQNRPNVRQAARAAGYRGASGLRQQFKRFYGYNPSEIETEGFDYDAAWRKSEESAS